MSAFTIYYLATIRPNLELNTQPKQPFSLLPLDTAPPLLIVSGTPIYCHHEKVLKIEVEQIMFLYFINLSVYLNVKITFVLIKDVRITVFSIKFVKIKSCWTKFLQFQEVWIKMIV